MPHGARKRSVSGFYHAVPKGVAGQMIFESDADRGFYRLLLAEAKRLFGMKIHAYCLMSNHVHLVVEDLGGKLPDFMKYVHERYGSFFAQKIGREGGIFNRPYWSEPIENESYLCDAVRYTHANPAAAGLCAASAYEWSSAKDYLGREGLTDTSMVLDLLGGKDGFIEFSRQMPMPAKAFPGSRLRSHLTDDEIMSIAKATIGEGVLRRIKKLSPVEQRICVAQLQQCGLTLRQVVRVTGLGYNFVQKAWKK